MRGEGRNLGHGVAERARGLAARLWAERAPEHAVVVVAAARVVELGGLGARHERDQVRLWLARHRLVQVCDVGLVVEVVVEKVQKCP